MIRATAFSALLLAGAAPLAPAVTITDTVGDILVKSPAWQLNVGKSPYRLSLSAGGRTILAQPSSGGTSVSVDEAVETVSRVSSWSSTADSLSLEVTTNRASRALRLVLSFEPDAINLTWSFPPGWAGRIEERFSLGAGVHWYGGDVTTAHVWPLESGSVTRRPFLATSNQTVPVWLASSGAGIFVSSYGPIGFSINENGDGLFRLESSATPRFEYRILAGSNIIGAWRAFVGLAGKPGVVPPREYFAEPIFNTWIEFMTDVSQAGVVDYAHKIRDSGFPCSILILDDGWAAHYGDHVFHPVKFPEPKKMVDEVHRLGFKFALWVVPFMERDAGNFPVARDKGHLVLEPGGKEPAIVRWWNGLAGLVDLSNPATYGWYLDELLKLQREYGVDGFKLDAGDAEYFRPDFVTHGRITPNRYTDLFAGLGRHFEINELRVSWLAQPWGLVERLRDKSSDWSLATGIGSIVPHGLAVSLIGYPFFCPDIIGGGLDTSFKDPNFAGMDEELFVRWTQASAFMPMMQFSYAPWRLSEPSRELALKYALIHRDLAGYIYSLALRAREDGTPIVRPLFWRNPEDERTYTIRDQFLLGDRFLVAPVLEKGARSRAVYLPSGLWKDFWSGKIYAGGRDLEDYSAPLETLPVFLAIE